jgi:hypothetical protein
MKPGTTKPAPHDDGTDVGYAAGQVIGVVLLLLCGVAFVVAPLLLVQWVRGAPARKARREAEERAREEVLPLTLPDVLMTRDLDAHPWW